MNRLTALTSRFLSATTDFDDQLFIDAGSSNTRIYVGERLVFSEPTCVAVHVPSDTVVAIGTKAQKLLGKTAENIAVSFPIQYGVVASPTYLEAFLTSVLKRIKDNFSLKRTIMGMKIWCAVPAEASPVDKQFLREILGQTGFSNIVLVPGVEAAYHNVVSGGSSTQGYCVLDIGGQTSEIGVFSTDSLVKGQTFRWGGVQFTEILQDLIRSEHQCAVGWHVAEAVKKEIGKVFIEELPTNRQQKTAVRGKDVVNQVSKTVVVSSALFEDQFTAQINDLHHLLETFFAELPSELATNALDQGIYITGSGSQLAGFSEAIARKLQSSVHYSKEPEMDSIKGLVRYAKANTL